MNTAELRGGQRHDLWLTLNEVKVGRLYLAVTIIEVGAKCITARSVHRTVSDLALTAGGRGEGKGGAANRGWQCGR